MNTIETKYAIGDTVFHAGTSTERKQHPCPDCKGSRKWKATSPAGNEYDFSCPRCSVNYQSNRELSLDYQAAIPVVHKLTIGSISHNTHASRYRGDSWQQAPETQYMCRETGVGSGSIYYEDTLFQTEDEALVKAQVLADEVNAKTDWIVSTYDRTLSLSDYQFENALIREAKDQTSRARSMLYNLSYLFEKIDEADDKDAILEEVNWYREYDWQRDKDKIAELTIAEPA